jgi:hypothetical protein
LQWRSPCDTAGGQMIFRVLPDVSIFPLLRTLIAGVSAPAHPLAVAVWDVDDPVPSARAVLVRVPVTCTVNGLVL